MCISLVFDSEKARSGEMRCGRVTTRLDALNFTHAFITHRDVLGPVVGDMHLPCVHVYMCAMGSFLSPMSVFELHYSSFPKQ